MGITYHKRGGIDNEAKADYWLSKAAEQGNADAKKILDNLNRNRLFKEDYLRAAARGDPKAQYALALMYQKGDGYDKDLNKAARWFAMAAKQGHNEAQYELALMLQNGDGVTRDLDQAKHWARLAAEAGYFKAHKLLADLKNDPGSAVD